MSPRRVVPAALAALLAAPAVAAPPLGPTAQLKQTNERIDRILKQKKGDDPASKEEMKSIVNGFLDYDELARRTLGGHWDEITPAQRDDFTRTFRDVIEKNYLKQMRGNADYEVVYKGETVDGATASVATVVKIKTKGKSTETSIDYKLKKTGERWLVFDIITDDVSMVTNYKQQFNKTITNEKFEGLMRKLHKKADELDKPDGAGKPAAEAASAPQARNDKNEKTAQVAQPTAGAKATKSVGAKAGKRK